MAPDEAYSNLLAGAPLFEGLSSGELSRFAGSLHRRVLPAGATVIDAEALALRAR